MTGGATLRVAAIDCGTNSIRLLIADLPTGGGPPQEVTRQMEIVRLGEGVDRTGRLTPAAIERTRVALAGYTDEIKRLGAERIRMVATSASRDADNAEDFREMVRVTLGGVAGSGEALCVAPEVVSGDEEARLSFTGAVGDLLPARNLVIDIGGGSTEFVVGSTEVDAAISVDIGCVRLTERHLHGDPPTAAQIEAASHDIEAAVDRALAVVGAAAIGPADVGPAGVGRAPIERVIGLAGSVTTVAAIALNLSRYQPERIHHTRVSTVDVERITADLLASTRERRLAIPVMHPGRADVIGAGALILRTILRRTAAPAVIASEHDILDGIALSLAG